MDAGTPVGAEAAGDLAEHDRRTDFPLGDVVGGRHLGVLEEDEELGAPRLDGGLQLTAGRVRRREGDKRVEAALGAGVILPQRRWPSVSRRRPMRIAQRSSVAQPGAKTESPQSMAYWTSRRTWARQT